MFRSASLSDDSDSSARRRIPLTFRSERLKLICVFTPLVSLLFTFPPRSTECPKPAAAAHQAPWGSLGGRPRPPVFPSMGGRGRAPKRPANRASHRGAAAGAFPSERNPRKNPRENPQKNPQLVWV